MAKVDVAEILRKQKELLQGISDLETAKMHKSTAYTLLQSELENVNAELQANADEILFGKIENAAKQAKSVFETACKGVATELTGDVKMVALFSKENATVTKFYVNASAGTRKVKKTGKLTFVKNATASLPKECAVVLEKGQRIYQLKGKLPDDSEVFASWNDVASKVMSVMRASDGKTLLADWEGQEKYKKNSGRDRCTQMFGFKVETIVTVEGEVESKLDNAVTALDESAAETETATK
jgi:hypothetical protein